MVSAVRTAPKEVETAQAKAPDASGKPLNSVASVGLTAHTDTPGVVVFDNRGLSVRSIGFNRRAVGEAADIVIGRSEYDDRGRLLAAYDGRFSGLGASTQTPPLANFTADAFDLGGGTLRSRGIDNGERIGLVNAAGQPVLGWDAKETQTRMAYDAVGRPVAHYEQIGADGAETVRERMVYGDAALKGRNLNGAVVRAYGTAGLDEVHGVALSGGVLRQSTRFLADPDSEADWQGDAEAGWQALLDANRRFETAYGYNAAGQQLTMTDAMGNIRRQELDEGGMVCACWLQQAGGAEVQTFMGIAYSANGQVVREEAGNGVVSTYAYEPETLRLIRSTATRPATGDRATVLHDFVYAYDPVGNITSITDEAVPERFYRNQKVAAHSSYTYDAFYQLIEARGREQDTPPDVRGPQSSAQMPAVTPHDQVQWRTYTQRYSYDLGNNLTVLRHMPSSGTGYTKTIMIAAGSNRGVDQDDWGSITPEDVDARFDANGNQCTLGGATPLNWNARDQLRRHIIVARGEATEDDDYETYSYAGAARVRKYHKVWTTPGTAFEAREVIYLPGLELRRKTRQTVGQQDTLVEELHVLSGSAGRSALKVLHWTEGRPVEIGANDQYRYSLDNHLGSSMLELDQAAEILTFEEYYPFGGTAVWSSRNETEADYKFIRYSGKERDQSGLYFYGHRYYQPGIGRWLSADPSGTQDGFNLYRFCHNNPINLIDPDGLAPMRRKEARLRRQRALNRFQPFDRAIPLRTNGQLRWLDALESAWPLDLNPLIASPDPRNVSHITDSEDLKEALKQLQANHAESATEAARAAEAAIAAGLASPDEVNLDDAKERQYYSKKPPLFFYAQERNAGRMAEFNAVRWSGGISKADKLYQRGSFPPGGYATVIAPYEQDVSRADMATSFYSRDGAPWFNGDAFVMFAGDQSWSASGYLLYDELATRYPDYMRRFAHVSKLFSKYHPTGLALAETNWDERAEEYITGLEPRTYIPTDLIAFGLSLIPHGVANDPGNTDWEKLTREGNETRRPLTDNEMDFLESGEW